MLKPAKLLFCSLTIGVQTADVVPSGPWTGYPFRWNATLAVTAQPHGDDTTLTPYYYDGLDVAVGDFIVTAGLGRIMRVYSISAQTSSSVTCVLEDRDFQNIYEDQAQSGGGSIADGDGYLFEVKDGLPIVHPIPDALAGLVPPYFAADVTCRFLGRKLFREISVDQTAHGLAIDELIYLDGTGYHKATSTNIGDSSVVGIVTEVSISPDRFKFRPLGDLMEVAMPSGAVGSLVYLSSTGTLTTTQPTTGVTVPVYIKVDANSGIYVLGRNLGAVTGGLQSALAAGATPVDTDVLAWPTVSSGIVKCTGGRIFLAHKNAADVYYVELTAI